MFLSLCADQQLPMDSMKEEKAMKIKSSDYQTAEGDREVPVDSSVTQIIGHEFKFKRELWRLQKILRRAMTSDDPLPVFNRRHLLILVKRLCKDIDKSSSAIRNCTDIWTLSDALQESMQHSHSLLCIAFTDALQEMREFLKREKVRRGDPTICYCIELHADRSLLPLHRLKYLRALGCLLEKQRNIVNSALDGCYATMSALHGERYVSEVDNLLDFSLNMDPPPFPYYSVAKQEPIYQELMPELKQFESKDDHLYEEIGAPEFPKPKKKSFFAKHFIKDKGHVSAEETLEYIPISRIPYSARNVFI